ncbi:IS701 family transposase, partial [Methylobacterium soli]
LARVRRLANGPPPKTTLIAKLVGAVVHPGDPARGNAAGAAAH